MMARFLFKPISLSFKKKKIQSKFSVFRKIKKMRAYVIYKWCQKDDNFDTPRVFDTLI